MTRLFDQNRHLTEEQIYMLLESPEQATETAAGAHLLACGRCHAEFTAIQTSFADFRVATTGLAAASVRELLPYRTNSQPSARRFGTRGMALSFATAVLAVGATLPFVHPSRTASPAAGSAVRGESPESDEALLEGITQDLSTSVPPSLEPLAPRSDKKSVAR